VQAWLCLGSAGPMLEPQGHVGGTQSPEAGFISLPLRPSRVGTGADRGKKAHHFLATPGTSSCLGPPLPTQAAHHGQVVRSKHAAASRVHWLGRVRGLAEQHPLRGLTCFLGTGHPQGLTLGLYQVGSVLWACHGSHLLPKLPTGWTGIPEPTQAWEGASHAKTVDQQEAMAGLGPILADTPAPPHRP
jgi:hypothetical protein